MLQVLHSCQQVLGTSFIEFYEFYTPASEIEPQALETLSNFTSFTRLPAKSNLKLCPIRSSAAPPGPPHGPVAKSKQPFARMDITSSQCHGGVNHTSYCLAKEKGRMRVHPERNFRFPVVHNAGACTFFHQALQRKTSHGRRRKATTQGSAVLLCLLRRQVRIAIGLSKLKQFKST